MQTTLLSLAIAVILALLAALLGPYFVDWNAHRATFEEQASAAIGLPVRVTGSMDVRLLPSPSLVLSGVEIGMPGDPQALRARALGIEFALPPLLSGKLRAVEMRLIAPEMRLSLEKDGRAVFPNALAGVNAEALSIDKLVVEDARFDLTDVASGVSTTLSKLWFNGEVRALPGPIRGEGAFVMDGALYGYRLATARPEANGSRIKLSIDPSDRPLVAEAEGFLTADGGTPRFEGQTTIARRTGGKGDKNAPDEPWRITARVKANAAAALFEQVEFQYGPDERALKLTGAAEATFGAKPRLDVVLSARQLDADKLIAAAGGSANLPPRAALAAVLSSAGGIAPPPIPTQLGFGIDAVTLGGGTLQNVRGDIEFGRGRASLTAFEARAPGFTQLQASGEIDYDGDRLSFAGPVEITSVDPRIFGDWFEGRTLAALPSRPLRLRGDVTLGAGRIGVERLRAELDRKTFDGGFSYSFADSGNRSRLDLRLRADELDLDALMQLAGPVKGLIEQPDDVSLALSLERLLLAGMDAGKADLKLALAGGALTVERFAIGDLAGLAIDSKGRIDLQSQTPSGNLAFSLDIADAAALVALAGRIAPGWAATLERSGAALAPAKLQGTLTVAPESRATRASLTLGGPVGAAQLALKTTLTGALAGGWLDIGRSDVAMEGSLEAGDVNALVKLAGADKFVSVPQQPGTFKLSLHGKADADLKLDTRIVSANLDARANGSIRPFAADGKSAALDLGIGKADLVLAGHALPVTLRAAMKSDAFGVRFDKVSATVAGAGLQGRLGLSFSEPTVIDGEVKADSLDLAAVLAAATGLAPADAAAGEKGWRELPFAPPAMPALTGEVTLAASRARLSPGLPATGVRTRLVFAPMQIRAEAIDAALLGGRLSGEVAVRRGAEGIAVQGKLSVKDADAAQLLFADGAAPLSGRATLAVQFDGAGLSPRALIGSLNGSGTLSLAKARFAALDPKAFAVAARSVDQGLPLDVTRIRDVVARALDAGPLTLASAEASLAIAAGVARIESFTARSDNAEVAVTGSYNLADARIDTRFVLSGAAQPHSVLRPELSVMLRGPASAPERSLDVSALTGWLALRSVDRQAKRIEAIEQGRPADAALQTPDEDAAGQLPESAPALPRRKPPATPQASPAPAADPLPAPVEIRPAASDRRRPQRVEGAPQGNPFPKPLGSPPPQQTPPPILR